MRGVSDKHCLLTFFISSKSYDKQDDFNFEIVNFPFFDGDVPRSPSYGVYISQLIHFARACSNISFVSFDSSRPSKQFFIYIRTGLPGLYRY